MNIHVSRLVGALATVAVATMLPVVAAEAAVTEEDANRGLSVADAPYYLDVHDKIPPSFRQLTPEEATQALGQEDDPDSAAVGYTTERGDAIVMLQLTVGKGRSAWSVFEHDVAHAEEAYRGDDLAKTLVDADLPSDQISVAPAQWTDVAVGDSARTALFNIEVAQLGTLHFEMLVMAVRAGTDAALVVVAHGFEAAPSFAVADVAREIAARLKSGPPTPERTIAEAGLVAIGDLPAGWQERTDHSSDATSPPSTTGTTSDSTGGEDESKQIRKVAKSIPACQRFVTAFDESGAIGAQRGRTAGSDNFKLEGATFKLGPATASSLITLYPTSATASETFRLLRAPSTKACMTQLYKKVTVQGLKSAAKNSGTRGLDVTDVRVDVTTPRASAVGDDRLLIRVSAELPSMGHIRVMTEQEYVRTGRAVAQYTFSDVGKVTIREDVVRAVSERVAAAPGVR